MKTEIAILSENLKIFNDNLCNAYGDYNSNRDIVIEFAQILEIFSDIRRSLLVIIRK